MPKQDYDSETAMNAIYDSVELGIQSNPDYAERFVKYSNDDLQFIYETKVDAAETAAIHVFSEIDTLGKTKEDISNSTYAQFFLEQFVMPVVMIEVFMKHRGILEDIVEETSVVNYYTAEMYCYPSYFLRYLHLLDMAHDGLFEDVDDVYDIADEATASYNDAIQKKETAMQWDA